MPSDSSTPPPHTPPELPAGLAVVHSSPPGTPKIKESSSPSPTPMTRAELLDSAEKFLRSAPIMNAPLKEKLDFLHTKGLTREEIEALMEKLAEGTMVLRETGKKKKEEDEGGKKKEEDKGKGKELVKAGPSTTSTALVPSKPASSSSSSSSSSASTSTTTTSAPVAPIVTYPEFLTPAPPAPPAPLTFKTLGKSLYFATGAAATIYGANKFVLSPMYDALTDARLDLASTALTNLTTLNTRLTELLPAGATPKARTAADDSDSDTSDPGELFHVDASTQTNADLGADLGSDSAELSPDGKLERLGAQLQTLVESHSDGTDNELTFALEDLTSYLETLTYEWPGANIYTSPYGGYGGGAGGAGMGGKDKDKDDPVAKVKAEIRSVKGVLLNRYVAVLSEGLWDGRRRRGRGA